MRKEFLIFLIFPIFVFALDCDKTEETCKTLSPSECLSLLQDCVRFYEERIKGLEGEIDKVASKKKTLFNEINILEKRIKKLNLEIQQTSLLLKETELQVQETEKAIKKIEERIEKEKKILHEILRAIEEAEKSSLLEILISQRSLSGFYDNLFDLKILNQKIKEILETVKGLKSDMEEKKEALEDEKNRQEKLLNMAVLQRKENESLKNEKNKLLAMTESEYQKLLKEKETVKQKAAQLRRRIFELIGIEKPPTFGEAYEIAKYVEKVTGVRPAFLLAILTQESNLGKNVGQCYLKDPKTGSGVRIGSGEKVARVMAPGPPYSKTNQVAIFMEIMKELGKDPFFTPVSCPMSFGWGGAMGPAQFIPSTWQKYKPKIEAITKRPANPWNILDSFLAAGLYLADAGAANKTPEGEWRAALIYFSGGTNPIFSWYGKEVMRLAQKYQEEIQILEQALTQTFSQG